MRWRKEADWEVTLYYTRCPICYRYLVSLSRLQLEENVFYHLQKHRVRGFHFEELPPLEVYEKKVVLSAPPKTLKEVEAEVRGQP